MAQFTQWIVGVFPDRAAADGAIHDLKDAGFDATRIGLAIWARQENATTHEQGTETADAVAESEDIVTPRVGALVVPNAGSFIAAGALASTLVGDSAGHITRALMAMGLEQGDANAYQRRLEQGEAIVALDAQERADEAQTIMRRCGALDMREGQPEADRVGVGVSGETLPASDKFRGSGAPIDDTPGATALTPRPDAATPTSAPTNPQLPPEMPQWSDLGDPSLDPVTPPASALSSSAPSSPHDAGSARRPDVVGHANPPTDHPRTDSQILEDAGESSGL